MSPRGLGLLLLWGLCLLASPGWASSLDWLSQGRSLLDLVLAGDADLPGGGGGAGGAGDQCLCALGRYAVAHGGWGLPLL